MEIKQIIGNTFCLMGKQLIPLYMTDSRHCILLDTGARYDRQEIEESLAAANITPIGLLCTHTHFDHFGNASYFSKKYGCPVALPLGEAEVCRTLQSVKSHLFAYSEGFVAASPIMQEIPCIVDHVIRPEEQDTFFRGVRFRVLHTPGHSIDHVSYITPDNVCYAGDALMCGKSLFGTKLPYAFHFGRTMDTIRSLRGIDCSAMILAHSGVFYEGFAELSDSNLSYIEGQLDCVRALVDRPMSAAELCEKVCTEMKVKVTTPEKAMNLERFLRPYIEHMLDEGQCRMIIRGNTLCYEPIPEEKR